MLSGGELRRSPRLATKKTTFRRADGQPGQRPGGCNLLLEISLGVVRGESQLVQPAGSPTKGSTAVLLAVSRMMIGVLTPRQTANETGAVSLLGDGERYTERLKQERIRKHGSNDAAIQPVPKDVSHVLHAVKRCQRSWPLSLSNWVQIG